MLYAASFILGAVVASIPWWIKVRGLNGVVTDLKNAKYAVQQSAKKV